MITVEKNDKMNPSPMMTPLEVVNLLLEDAVNNSGDPETARSRQEIAALVEHLTHVLEEDGFGVIAADDVDPERLALIRQIDDSLSVLAHNAGANEGLGRSVLVKRFPVLEDVLDRADQMAQFVELKKIEMLSRGMVEAIKNDDDCKQEAADVLAKRFAFALSALDNVDTPAQIMRIDSIDTHLSELAVLFGEDELYYRAKVADQLSSEDLVKFAKILDAAHAFQTGAELSAEFADAANDNAVVMSERELFFEVLDQADALLLKVEDAVANGGDFPAGLVVETHAFAKEYGAALARHADEIENDFSRHFPVLDKIDDRFAAMAELLYGENNQNFFLEKIIAADPEVLEDLIADIHETANFAYLQELKVFAEEMVASDKYEAEDADAFVRGFAEYLQQMDLASLAKSWDKDDLEVVKLMGEIETDIAALSDRFEEGSDVYYEDILLGGKGSEHPFDVVIIKAAYLKDPEDESLAEFYSKIGVTEDGQPAPQIGGPN